MRTLLLLHKEILNPATKWFRVLILLVKAFSTTKNRRVPSSFLQPTPNAPQWATRQYACPTQPRRAPTLGPEIFRVTRPKAWPTGIPLFVERLRSAAALVRGHGDPWFEKQMRHLSQNRKRSCKHHSRYHNPYRGNISLNTTKTRRGPLAPIRAARRCLFSARLPASEGDSKPVI